MNDTRQHCDITMFSTERGETAHRFLKYRGPRQLKRRWSKVHSRLVLFVIASLSAISVAYSDDWDSAEREIVRLSPSEMGFVPSHVVEELSRVGCAIPQIPYYSKEKVNLIAGHFGAQDQKDYAALCSVGGESHIHIVWGGPVRCQPAINFSKDRGYLQHVGGVISYSRQIYRRPAKEIAEIQSESGYPPPPATGIDGIEDAFLEKASGIFMCVNGEWVGLFGSD